jgi:hypothetical protein
MKKIIGLLVLVLFCLPPLEAQREEEIIKDECTGGKLSGRCWIILPAIQKKTYIAGLVDGIALLEDRIVSTGLNSNAVNNLINNEFVPIGRSRFKEFVPIIDLFYIKDANRFIPISYAYLFAIKKMNGASQEELDKYAASLRLQFGQPKQKKRTQ